MSIPSALHPLANHLRAVPTSADRPPCLLSTQPGCLALAMTLLIHSKTPPASGRTQLIVTPTQEEAEQV
ncbi:MAG: hypothetical protein KC643_22040, partial [Nitrospira sp.]|nr:hypothetical protein [Nitrospira sp.]